MTETSNYLRRNERDAASGVQMLQVRLPGDLIRQIDHLRIDLGLKRPAVVELLLREAVARYVEQEQP